MAKNGLHSIKESKVISPLKKHRLQAVFFFIDGFSLTMNKTFFTILSRKVKGMNLTKCFYEHRLGSASMLHDNIERTLIHMNESFIIIYTNAKMSSEYPTNNT